MPRSSYDNSNDDNDSKSNDGFDDHDSQDGGGEAYGISLFIKEACFTHVARPKSRYQDKELLAYRKERRIVVGHGTQTVNILDHFHELRIIEK